MNVSTEMKLKSARVRLVTKHPFFGALLLRTPLEATTRVPTAAVDKHGHVMINPEFVDKLSTDEVEFLLAHEVMHVAFAHLARRGNRDAGVWNYVNDAIINDMLEDEGVGRMIEGAVRLSDAKEHSSEELYEMYKNQPKAKEPSVGDLMGEAPDGGSATRQAIAQAKANLSSARTLAKMSGRLSSGLDRVVGGEIASKVPWYTALERYFTASADQHTSWSRPNRRYLRTAYLPRRESMPSMDEVVIGIDTSGSITDEDLQKYFGHLNAIISQVNPKKVHVVYADDRVQKVDTYTRDDYPLKPGEPKGLGGTDMCEVVRWCNDNAPDAKLCVIFTDGYTPLPSADEVRVPLIWVCTTEYLKHQEVVGECIFDT